MGSVFTLVRGGCGASAELDHFEQPAQILPYFGHFSGSRRSITRSSPRFHHSKRLDGSGAIERLAGLGQCVQREGYLKIEVRAMGRTT
jgi:hypothetical protein